MKTELLEGAIRIMVMAIVIAVILLFLAVGMLVIIHVFIVGRAFGRRFGNNGRSDRNSSSRNRTMSQDELQKLPCYDYMAKDKGTSPVDCAVCLESFKMGEKCRLLPLCGHSFHAECVDSWLLRNPICPICRTTADPSSHFSENVVELREINLEDVRIEIRDDQIREGSNVNENGHESRDNQTTTL